MKISVIVVLILGILSAGAVIGYFIFQHVYSTSQITTNPQNATQDTSIPQNAAESTTKGTTIPPQTKTELE